MINDTIITNKIRAAQAILDVLKENNTYAEIAALTQVNGAVLWRLHVHGQAPQGDDNRRKLGLPILREVPVCECGQVHISKRCAAKRVQYKDLYSMPVSGLRERLENREVMR